jgi:hypothetical protein
MLGIDTTSAERNNIKTMTEEEIKFEDISASHSLLNTLHSGLTGALIFHQILEESHDLHFSEEVKHFCEKTLARSTKWLEDLYGGHPLISKSWTEIEDFEAKLAFDSLERLSKDLSTTLGTLDSFDKNRDEFYNPANTRFLFACFARLMYARREFFRQYDKYSAEYLQQPVERGTEVEEELKGIDNVRKILLRGGTLDQSLIQEIGDRGQDLIPALAILRHEMIILARMYDGLTFEALDIRGEEEERWKAYQFEPAAVGYWRAQYIGPEEAVAWMHGGVSDPGLAAVWRSLLFSPMDTGPWMNAGISPVLARLWKDEGFPPSQAIEFIQKGVFEPPKGKRK